MTETTESGTEAPAARQAPEEVPRPKGIGPLGWLRWAWRQLTTMRTALILLFLTALGAVPGSILPQRGQAPEKVVAYLDEHKTLGPWLDKFSMFDVFAAPWFAAIYILLFVSLAGCVLPRALKHYQSMRARPPAAPRNLGRLPQSATYETDASPEDVLAEARTVLRGRRFRVDVSGGAASAEKGYLGESGNLLFHLALLALLFALGLGNLLGYRGNVLLTEGKTFANSLSLYDQFQPGRAFHGGELAPFTITLDDFKARYETEGDQRGMGTDFNAHIRYRSSPDAEERPYDLKINHPLKVGGAKVYLLGHGYAPVFTVRDAKGNVAFQDSVPFLEMEPRNLTSEGVIKAPDAEPDQLAFYAILWPTAAASEDGKQIVSAFPAPLRPVITVTAFKGDIGLDSGTPQSVYKLEGIGKTLQPVKGGQKLLEPGETFELPDGAGSITFDGLKEWTSLSVNRDPGRIPALIAAILAVLGVATSFMVRRRRVWVRASAGEGGRTVVEVGGLTLGNPTSEFDDIVTALRGPEDEDEPGPQDEDEDEDEPGPEPGPEPDESDTDAGQEPGSAPEPKE
jgi:cytochrome c biogenesis protein